MYKSYRNMNKICYDLLIIGKEMEYTLCMTGILMVIWSRYVY